MDENVKLVPEALDDRTVRIDGGPLGEILVLAFTADDGSTGWRVVTDDAAPGVPVSFG